MQALGGTDSQHFVTPLHVKNLLDAKIAPLRYSLARDVHGGSGHQMPPKWGFGGSSMLVWDNNNAAAGVECQINDPNTPEISSFNFTRGGTFRSLDSI